MSADLILDHIACSVVQVAADGRIGMLLDIVLIVIGRIIVYILQLVVGGGRVGGNVFFLFNNTQPKINYNYNFPGALSGYPLLVLAAGLT